MEGEAARDLRPSFGLNCIKDSLSIIQSRPMRWAVIHPLAHHILIVDGFLFFKIAACLTVIGGFALSICCAFLCRF